MEGGDRFPVDNIPEVWLNVYDKLDPKDKLAFFGASSVWHDWVEPKRTESLLSEVKPELADGLPLSNFLQRRELCQSWMDEIDHENQTHASNLHFTFEIASGEEPRCSPSLLCGIYFEYAENIRKFMQDMRTHAGNPFPGRSIGLVCYLDFNNQHEDFNETWRDHWRSTISLLENWGSHVHFADIDLEDFDELQLGNLESQGYLRECLLRLPNLKKVSISGEFGRPFLEDEIREYYRLNPLPQLEHLETVILGITSLATVDEFFNSCCVPANIKRLALYQHPRHSDAVYRFENLEVLKASILFRHLERLASLERRPPLREVVLSFEDAPYLDDVFMLLEVFGETLIQFRSSSRMRLRNDVVDGEPFSCNLPHLKKIFFKEYWGTAELLFQFKSLTHVKIWRMRDTSWQYPGFQERLSDSRIWTLMPCLQWLSLGNPATVYKRKVMEQSREVLEQSREVLEQSRVALEQPMEVLEIPWEVLEQPWEVLEQSGEVLELEQPWEVLEHQPQPLGPERIDNTETEGLRETTWSGEWRSIVMDMMVSVLADLLHGVHYSKF